MRSGRSPRSIFDECPLRGSCPSSSCRRKWCIQGKPIAEHTAAGQRCYAGPDESEHYAGGVDGNQIRTMLRLGALKSWTAGCTDIRTAFLNASRRYETRLMAMEIPIVFKKLGLAESNEVWLIDKAIYGLTTSPRAWSLSTSSS